MISFTRSLKASAKQVERAAPADFVRLLQTHWESRAVQIYEWLADNPRVRVYFDVDGKTSETSEAELMERCRTSLVSFFGDQPNFDLDADIMFATSHGGPKLSIRAYAPTFTMRVADIKLRIKALRLGNKDGGVFDEAVYGTRQKIRAVGAIKTPQDSRPLAIADREDAHLYVIQHVPEDAVELPVPRKRPPERTPAVRTRPPPPAPPPRTVDRSEDESDDEVMLPAGGGGLPDEAQLLPLLTQAGFAGVSVRHRKAPFLKFDADRARPCACCQQTHERQLWFATRLVNGHFYVKSYSPRCTGLRLTPPVSPEAQAEVERQLATIEDSVGVIRATTRNLLVSHKHIIDSSLKGATLDLSTVYNVDQAEDAFGFRSCRGREYVAQNIIQTLYSITPTRSNSSPILAGYCEADIVQGILKNPRGADACYASWFISAQALRGVAWKSEPSDTTAPKLYRHSGVLWERVTDGEFESLFATTALPKMLMLEAALRATREGPFADEAAKKVVLKQVVETVKHLQNTKASRAMLGYARLLTTAPNFGAGLDRDRHLLGSPSGVIDLRTGELLPTSSRPPVSMSVRPRYHGLDTPTPDVDAFFRMVFDDDAAMVDYMQALLGAATTGERLEVYACFVGAGANGKGVTVGWLRHVLYDYYKEADPYIFFGDKRHGTGPTPALAELDRKRLAVVDESAPTDELNLAIVKRVTGTDVISCRQLYRDPKEMPVTHTQILLTNNLPKFDVDDQALERRIVVIPFNLRFVKDADFDESERSSRRADPTLARFLESESPSEQLLVWLVRGAMRFYAAGHRLPAKPEVVCAAERGYYRDNDLLGQLIEEVCKIRPEGRMEASVFNSMVKSRGVKGSVSAAMGKRGYKLQNVRGEAGRILKAYLGIEFTTDVPV